MRLMLAALLAVCGLAVVPGTARSVPGICPPFCDAIPDAAWIESSSLPLYPVYRWPGLAGLAVTAPAPRFGFEEWCASPTAADDPRDYVVAARAEVANPDGQWNLRVQVLHWRGPVVTGGRTALETLEKARMALALCHLTAPAVSPSITSSDAERIATVISDGGRRVMHAYLLADPGSSSVVEVALWSTLPTAVEWPAVRDSQVFDAMAAPLCAAYLGSCR
ncbi:MAG: ATPase [Dietzia sp.]|nr:ATPase [Dietzia sp.]